MKKSKQILTILKLMETRFCNALIRRNITRFMVINLALLIASVASAQERIPSGTVEIDETQLGFIIGGDIGKGVLYYKGVDFYFKTGGIKVGGMGVAKISAVGEAYDLFDIDQFPGTYVTGDYGIALGGGVGGLVLKNENNVYLRLRSTLEGVALAVGLEGMTIKLEDAVQAPVQQGGMQQQAGQTYTVQSGDTLYEIANRFGVTVSDLKRSNNLTSDMIRVEQVLYIPQ